MSGGWSCFGRSPKDKTPTHHDRMCHVVRAVDLFADPQRGRTYRRGL